MKAYSKTWQITRRLLYQNRWIYLFLMLWPFGMAAILLAPAAKPERQVSSVEPREADGDVALRSLAPPPEHPWTVNVSDGDQREMAVEDIVRAYASGLVTDDTFVWRVGMPEWVPLQEVSEIFDRAKTKS